MQLHTGSLLSGQGRLFAALAVRKDFLQMFSLVQDKPLSKDVDAASLARRTAGFSGAELANLVNEAALAAGKGGHAHITPNMLDEAQDKILMGSERRHGYALHNAVILIYCSRLIILSSCMCHGIAYWRCVPCTRLGKNPALT